MGMFDEIKVEVILPGNTEPTDEWFQTKSLDKCLREYVISAKGELYYNKWDYEFIENKEHILAGYKRRIDDSYRRVYLTDFHGDIIFYAGTADGSNVWRDYYARFTNGKLERMWYKDEQY